MEAKFFDSLYEGDSPNGVKLGMGLTGGDFWSRIAGCQMLYRGCCIDEIDFYNILTVTNIDAAEISPPSYVPHKSSSTYFYVTRRANNCGCEEHTIAAAVKVSLDADGELTAPKPNSIFEVKANRATGNKVELVWFYCPIGQESPPVCFNVYYDAGTGQIDYQNPLAAISYIGRRFYSYQSQSLNAGEYMFAIKTEDAVGVESNPSAPIKIQLDSTGPDTIEILIAEAV